MKSMKKTFALFVLFSMMVTCLSLSSFALEPDTVPSNTAPDADVAMSETDTVADAIEEDAVIICLNTRRCWMMLSQRALPK